MCPHSGFKLLCGLVSCAHNASEYVPTATGKQRSPERAQSLSEAVTPLATGQSLKLHRQPSHKIDPGLGIVKVFGNYIAIDIAIREAIGHILFI